MYLNYLINILDEEFEVDIINTNIYDVFDQIYNLSASYVIIF